MIKVLITSKREKYQLDVLIKSLGEGTQEKIDGWPGSSEPQPRQGGKTNKFNASYLTVCDMEAAHL